MTLPTGTISLSQVNVELLKSATATISLNDADVRALAAVPSGLIDLQDLQGKSAVFAYTITTNQTDLNLRTLALANGWNGTYAAQITIGSGVSINGSVAANSTPALTIDGSWPNGVTLINNGSILGRGGNGGGAGSAGTAGGRALTASVAVSINNVGTIAGGGGGGGGGNGNGISTTCDMDSSSCTTTAPGGGGGGGQSSVGFNASGGGGGGRGTCNGSATGTLAVAGGAGTSAGPGSGGAGGTIGSCNCINCSFRNGFTGGSGGAYGTAGTTPTGGAGGAAGQAVNGNSNITWIAFGTRLGTIV
jgi:hypothetical protein